MQPGSIVRFRERDWILLPSRDGDISRLRPLTGTTEEVVEVHNLISKIIGASIPSERINPSLFPPPSPEDLSDAVGADLLWQGARLTLRDGACPIRSLGRISIRPRTYQFVPLLMALRLEPVRLFIADDVGVGKTIEALLVVRELIDRGEIERFAILCPPSLCDQWEKELKEKFNLNGVVITSSTIGALERQKPVEKSIYEYFPYQIISIDWVKTERNRYQFLQFCPELIVVDEAHGAADTLGRNKAQQQRHALLKEIAKDKERHLMLLTATPHSGVENAFKSLLSLLNEEFATWDMGKLTEEQRKKLARHFVQRTRADILKDWEGEQCFARRISRDETYELSRGYRKLFDAAYSFCSELLEKGEKLEAPKRRIRYWGALALLRCIMSSPEAAVAALKKRHQVLESEEVSSAESALSQFIFEPSYDKAEDENPVPPIEEVRRELSSSKARKLSALMKQAEKLRGPKNDRKLAKCIEVVHSLIAKGNHPIVWCRYVATAHYIASQLEKDLGKRIQVVVITGRLGEQERRLKVEAIDPMCPRVLIATDCLSEGINLQEKFNAVIHYDLPWNPNRLEQREGRVDRFGQQSKEVVAVRLYGRDNAIDGAVLEVLLNKAREIYKALGTYVPVPDESESVMEALLNSLFLKKNKQKVRQKQLTLFEEYDFEKKTIQSFHEKWDREVNRERINRTRFAQRALKPQEVRRELKAADEVLGDPEAVKEFVLNAAQRINLDIKRHPKRDRVFQVLVSDASTVNVPDLIKYELPSSSTGLWSISFYSPTPEGAEYIGRNHPFVSALASFLLEDALTKHGDAVASRCGVIRTKAVGSLTALLLLRVRYLVTIPQKQPMLAEEVVVLGYDLSVDPEKSWLPHKKALNLLLDAKPIGNIPFNEKRELAKLVLDELGNWSDLSSSWGEKNRFQSATEKRIQARAKELEENHKRIRKAVSSRVRELTIRPQLPPDLLGVLVLQPEVRR